ncbi:hypothetical protein EYC84_000225 [Monilinia fructicola]|uniref:RanBP2-type domain-containing protein n=1 Tax=Monilinia fructicola TaxID=38448 RepID=A0A5M9JQY9_MONFR|nr:hypothetical protein EYC84_000225 [Monilinia fructicola]
MERREFIQGKIEKQQNWRAKSIEALIGLVGPKETPLLNKTTAANHEPVGSLIWSPYTTQEDPKRLTKAEEESMLIQLQQNVQGVARFIAGRFAAKEAAKKAFSKRRLGFHDITIDNPSLDNLRSRAPITLIKSTKGQEDQIVPMSISHDGDYATAVCMSCEDYTPPPMPDLQEIEPVLGRLLDEMTLKRLSRNASQTPRRDSNGRESLDTTTEDFSSENPPEERLSTPLRKVPVEMTTPLAGRLSEILNATPGGGSGTSATGLKSVTALEALRASEPVEPTSINDRTIESNLDVSTAPNPAHPKVSPPSPDGPKIKYHLSASSATSSINVDLMNKSFNRNSPGFQPRDYSFDGSQAKGNPSTGFQVKYYPVDGALSGDVPVLRPGDWVCQSEGCGSQNDSEQRRCVSCGTSRLEGWVNYIDPDSTYNKQLAEYANYTGLPFEIDPENEKKKNARIEMRQERLKNRTQSIYGLPIYIDPKVVKKNVENCLAVDNLPPGVTNEELIEAFKGRCAAIKGYVKVSRVGQIRAWIILSRKTEANKLRHLARKPDLLPVIRGRKLKITETDEWLRKLLREYANGTRRWDWRADFWTTDVYHAYNREECEQHAKRQAEEVEAKIAEAERLRIAAEEKMTPKQKLLREKKKRRMTMKKLFTSSGRK